MPNLGKNDTFEAMTVSDQKKIKILIMGAAGRDFHNFNVYFRNNDRYEVVAFTATQIPDIEGRLYPPELAGELYPKGIPIHDEKDLTKLIKEHDIDQVVLAYSDLAHEYVMHKASEVLAAGADFRLLGMKNTALKSTKPVIAVCAVRTGCGKSQTTRKIGELLRKEGKNVVVIRHPMPYGDLRKQEVQRFASFEDMDAAECTIEEREEYEPHIRMGNVVMAGVDYEKILREAEKEADIILWDGGNNDFPFYQPDVLIVVADSHRPHHEISYYPGETNFRMADIIIINKVDTAEPENVEIVRKHAQEFNPTAKILETASPVTIENPEIVKGKRVLVVEDGPTLTHGEMAYGAGFIAARNAQAAEIIDPRPFAVGSIKETFAKYTQVTQVLPAMGYGEQQLKELEETINKADCDVVVVATPIDLARLITINKPSVRVFYEFDPNKEEELLKLIKEKIPL